TETLALHLAFGVPAAQCVASAAGPGFTAVPGVGAQSYYGEGRLHAWKGGLLLDLQESGGPQQSDLRAMLSTDANDIFTSLDA
ncbi:MAG: hypothetical protein ACRD1G_11585, partial [Acidimicrobiales bacterium]